MSASQPRRQIELTEDGELRDVTGEPVDRLAAVPTASAAPAVYCTNCGSANRAHSNFCRTCGASLDEQTLEDGYPVSRPKVKRSEGLPLASAQRQPISSSEAAVEILTLFFVAGMVIGTTAFTHSAFL